jgi:hypothetical protein
MTTFEYVLPVEQTKWRIGGNSETVLCWDYDASRENLLKLYDKGKSQQWNAAERIDWKQDLDPENPVGMPDAFVSIYGSDIWERMTPAERANLRRHDQAFQISQFLHGEQGALVCSAKLVQQTPDIDAKLYAATQTMDEARHVEAYSRLLREKFEIAYPITRPLKALLENVAADARWDFTYLGMQVLIEGLALAAFQRFRARAANLLIASVTAYVMQDEARHVAFGRFALRDYYSHLSASERDEREEFVVEACHALRQQFHFGELWERLGLPVRECIDFMMHAPVTRFAEVRLFSRIVPAIKDIGLWGEKVRNVFAELGVLGLADLDVGAFSEEDERIAREFDVRRLQLSNTGNAGEQL